MADWYDRVTGESIKELPEIVIPGRFLTNKICTFNGYLTLEKGDFLLNDGTDKFHIDNLGSAHGRFSIVEKVDNNSAELDIIESAVLAYQDSVDIGNKSSFLIPEKLLARFEILKFEKLLLDLLGKGHLQEIARRPRMEMIYEEYLVPVSRAKKISSSANVHLASHSECWQTRTFDGVIPKKVLALESEDQLNIYENRVYVKLLGRVEHYLVKRIAEVNELEEIFKEAMNFQEAENIHFELRENICTLWGEGFSDDSNADDAAVHGGKTLDILKNMLKKVRTLQHSKLYRLLTHKLHVPLKLKMTNILSHDQHYRHVARLWDGWLVTQLVEKREPKDIYNNNKKTANSYVRYCFDLVKRTLSELGFSETGGHVFSRDGSSQLKISVNENSEINLTSASTKHCLILVPFFTEIYIDESIKHTEENQRVFLSLCNKNNLNDNLICSSPTNFYSIEALALFLSKWLAKQTYKGLGSNITKVPQTLLDHLDQLDNSHEENKKQWVVQKNIIVPTKPFLSLIPKIEDFQRLNKSDISIVNACKKIIEVATNFDVFLHCPCCGIKVDESQWLIRDSSCFSIHNSNCNHSWKVNLKTDGRKELVVEPTKRHEHKTNKKFQDFGRYSMTLIL